VQHHAALLDPAVVAAADDDARVHQRGADRDAPFAESALGFGDRRTQKLVELVHTRILITHPFPAVRVSQRLPPGVKRCSTWRSYFW
jgi:hypothetical protein